ncbi:MAG: hypothetical protein PW845_02495 [Pseudomonas sp.]|uniref:hypothetical protein n=1 Tax=Pseudomonas abieticivorans TaxID=2931382 RepID=UPI0020BFE2B8|nr:hypothetical protein [Pseudomonas sp. PIA16]MDE1164264.1 hypothetical protein [Pseudomonas sp.]
MKTLVRLSLLSLVVALSACTSHRPAAPSGPTIEPLPVPVPAPVPSTKPSAPATPAAKPMPRTSASFAPPPGGASHWDPRLGVYVLETQEDVYYRQRTYYRWDGGWSWSTSPNGPWQSTDGNGVPPGLGRLHAQ